jgi:hypothetical protein
MENSNKSKISIKIEGNTFDKNSIKIIAEFSDFPDTPIEALPFDYICALKNVLTYSSGIATKLLNAKMDYDSELSKEIDWITDEQYDSQSCSNMEELDDDFLIDNNSFDLDINCDENLLF